MAPFYGRLRRKDPPTCQGGKYQNKILNMSASSFRWPFASHMKEINVPYFTKDVIYNHRRRNSDLV